MPFLTQYSMARLPWPYGSAILVPRALIPLSGYLTGRGNNRYFFLHQIVARSERGCLPGDRVYGFPIRLPISREPGERRIDVDSSGGTLAGHGSCVSAASPCRNLHSIGGRPRWYGFCEAFTPSPACALSGGAGRARRTRGARTPPVPRRQDRRHTGDANGSVRSRLHPESDRRRPCGAGHIASPAPSADAPWELPCRHRLSASSSNPGLFMKSRRIANWAARV